MRSMSPILWGFGTPADDAPAVPPSLFRVLSKISRCTVPCEPGSVAFARTHSPTTSSSHSVHDERRRRLRSSAFFICFSSLTVESYSIMILN